METRQVNSPARVANVIGATAIILLTAAGLPGVRLVVSAGSRVVLQDRSGSSLALLDEAQTAVGAKRTRLRSITLHGLIVSGFNGITAEPLDKPKELEMRVLLPDHYIKIERDAFSVERRGFNGSVPFFVTEPVSAGGVFAPPSQQPGPEILALHRAYLSRLLLGMFATTDAIEKLTVHESSQTRSLAVSGGGGFAAQLDISAEGLPTRVRYMDNMRFPQPLTDEDRLAKRMPPPPKVEHVEVTISFDERQRTDELLIPRLIRLTAGGVRFEELRFDRVTVNPQLTMADFSR